jgi:hypothetical protein
MMVFEGLMTLDSKTLKPIPAAAAKDPDVSADGLKYTYTIRDGLKYSDGSPLAAKDFAYGYTRTCDPATHGDYSFVLYIIVGCEAWNGMDAAKATPAELSAAKAKLAAGDVILRFGGKAVNEVRELPRLVAAWPAGKAAQVEVWRDRKAMTLSVDIDKLATREPVAARTGGAGDLKSDTLGASLAAITPTVRQRYGIAEEIGGVLRCLDLDEDEPLPEEKSVGTRNYRDFK